MMWISYDLKLLEDTLRNEQYLRIKGISTFEEEDKNIMKRLITRKEATLPMDIDYSQRLPHDDRKRLYMRCLKLVKAQPLIQGEMAKLEEENTQRLDLYIK